MNRDIDNLINETLNNNGLVKINDNLYLKKYQKEILDLYHIKYQNCSSVSEVIYLIDEALAEDEIEELESVVLALQEFNYYHNTNK